VTKDELRALALRVLGGIAPEADLAALDPGADLREWLDLDSMDFLNFVVGLHRGPESTCRESICGLSTLDDCVAYLAAASGAKARPGLGAVGSQRGGSVFRIRLHGRGGQGIKTAARILGSAFFAEGFEAQDAPLYGAERRGAPIYATVRAARTRIFERGPVRRPDLVVVADETLLAVAAAGVLAGISPHSVLLLRSREPADTWKDRLQLRGRVLVLPAEADAPGAACFLGTTCAGAAARLVGALSRGALEQALGQELLDLSAADRRESVDRALAAFEFLSPEAGCVREGEEIAAASLATPDWIDVPSEHGPATELRHPGPGDERTGAHGSLADGAARDRSRDLPPLLVDLQHPVSGRRHPGRRLPHAVDRPRALQGLHDLRGGLPEPRHRERPRAGGRRRGEGGSGVSRELITGNAAAAWAARLARIDYLPAFPITPQTEIVETLERWIEAGEIDARLVTLESEHSVVAAAGAAALTGVRTFTATSSQGLLYAMEMLYTVAGWRAPFVLVNVSRGVAAPITLEPDHQDVLAARDCGFLQIHCASAQEVLDSVLIAHRLSEDPRVRLPVIVNLDGFHLSFTREPVAVPSAEQADAFLPPFDTRSASFRASKPVSRAIAVLGGVPYSYFRYEMHRASQAALAAYHEIAADFERACGRRWPLVETHRTEDAEVVLLLIGSYASKARDAVDRLREAGMRWGWCARASAPLSDAALRAALRGARSRRARQNLSMGLGGVLHASSRPRAASQCARGVASRHGLGRRDVTAEFFAMAEEALRAAELGRPPAPRLLYTEAELLEMRKLQGLAGAERAELAAAGDGRPEEEPS
jgi:pyruvate ferredoxin oxidoreductase alpha subunit